MLGPLPPILKIWAAYEAESPRQLDHAPAYRPFLKTANNAALRRRHL